MKEKKNTKFSFYAWKYTWTVWKDALGQNRSKEILVICINQRNISRIIDSHETAFLVLAKQKFVYMMGKYQVRWAMLSRDSFVC